jgi:hypothetical protein
MLKTTSSVINASQIATPITLPGNVTLSTGNLIIGTAGKGIDFSATSSGSGTMTSELLADYEEGTWTPSDGSGAGLSLTVAAATYVRIGKMVYASFGVTYPATVSASNARVAGLPFTSQNSAVSIHPVSISFTTASGLFSGTVDNNAATFFLVASGGVVFSNTNLSGAILRGTAIYEVA